MTASPLEREAHEHHALLCAARNDELLLRGALCSGNARTLCQRARERFETGASALTIRLDEVTQTDVVGLAALHQTADLAARLGVALTVATSPEVERALLEARLTGCFTIEPAWRTASDRTAAELAEAAGDRTPVLARTPELALRQPRWDELALFRGWAREPFLERMIGSELLYRCQCLGAYHPDFVSMVRTDPTSLTLLVEIAPEATPVGFVRLYGINLAEGFAFLETAIAPGAAARRGWGISASRLLLAFACDALRLHRVEAKVYAYNAPSINALRRNGFRQEGVLRAARAHDGQRWDILVFSILADEMREQRAAERFPAMGLWD